MQLQVRTDMAVHGAPEVTQTTVSGRDGRLNPEFGAAGTFLVAVLVRGEPTNPSQIAAALREGREEAGVT